MGETMGETGTTGTAAGLVIERLALEALVPYARNARTHSDAQVAQIAASIREFGFCNPVLIDAAGGIIAGHGRVLAARQLGMAEVPCIRLGHLTEVQRRAYVIADNKLALNAGWDEDLLALELSALRIEEFDLGLTGFDLGELDGLLDGLGLDVERTDGDTEPQIDRADELRKQWGVETGQLWQLGEHRLLCGDSTKSEDVARVLGGEKPHLMVTDPPYGVEYDADWRNHAVLASGKVVGSRAIGKVLNDDRADWRDAWALFPGDVAYVWHAGTRSPLVASSLEACSFAMRALIVWGKNRLVIGRGDYHHRHEPCWYAVRNGRTGHFNGDRTQTTLWLIDKPVKSETGHSTQKPIECMAIPVRNNSQPGDAVYEPFSGSGTTIIACENLNRRCRAIEISPGYVAIALQRWADHTGRTPVLCEG
jgi:DNA modification methylase